VKHTSRLSGEGRADGDAGRSKENADSLFATFGDFLKAASKAGAVAVIGGKADQKPWE